MPYRNALRDNFRRYMDVNDAEMRQYAQQYAQRYQPQGYYAAAEEVEPLDMGELVFPENGEPYILGSAQDPNMQQMEPMQGAGMAIPQQPETYYEAEDIFDNINAKKRAIAEALRGQ